MAENGRRKSGNEGQCHGHILVRGWFMAAAFSHHYSCSPNPIIQRAEKGHRAGKRLTSLHLTLTPPEAVFLYGLWKIPWVPMPALKAAAIFSKGADQSINPQSLSGSVSLSCLWLATCPVPPMLLGKNTPRGRKEAVSEGCKYSICSFWESYQSWWW